MKERGRIGKMTNCSFQMMYLMMRKLLISRSIPRVVLTREKKVALRKPWCNALMVKLLGLWGIKLCLLGSNNYGSLCGDIK